MAYVRIRPRRGTQAMWEAANPILSEGEIGFEVPPEGVGTGLVNFKIGDGITQLTNLPYAFAARTTVGEVTDLKEDVADLTESVTDMLSDISSIKNRMESLRRVDVQSSAPAEPTIGQVWIATDAVNGSMSFRTEEKTIYIAVGEDDSVRLVVDNSLSICDTVQFSIISASGTIDNPPCEIGNQQNAPSGPYVDLVGKYSGDVTLVATAMVLDPSTNEYQTIYKISIPVVVTMPGDIMLSATSTRVIVGHTCDVTATINGGLPVDEDGLKWSVGNSDYMTFEKINNSTIRCTAIKSSGTGINVQCNAYYKGSLVYQANIQIVTVGISLTQYALELDAGATSSYIGINNNMVKGTDYTDITVDSGNTAIATVIYDDPERSFRVMAGNYAGAVRITVKAMLGDTTVQTLNLDAVVLGRITLNSTQADINVDGTYTFTLSNSLGDQADGIRWTTLPENQTILEIVNSNTGGCIVKGKGTGTAWIIANATKDGVAISNSTNSSRVTASAVVNVAGSIYFPEGTPTTWTVDSVVNFTMGCTLRYGTDYDTITYDGGTAMTVIHDSDMLTLHITPRVSGTATLIARASKNGTVVKEATLSVNIMNKAVEGTLAISPGSSTIKPNQEQQFNLVISSYQLGTDYDSISWSIVNGDGATNTICVFKTTPGGTDTTVTVRADNYGRANIRASLVKAGSEIASTTAAIIVQGEVAFSTDIQYANVADVVRLSVNADTLVAGTYQYFTWSISNTAYATFNSSTFNPLQDSTGMADIRFGPNSGTVNISVAAKDANGNTISSTSKQIDVMGAVSITNKTVLQEDMAIGDIRTALVTNDMDDSLYARFAWSAVPENIVNITERSKTSCKIEALALGKIYLNYSLYDTGSNLIKNDQVTMVVQGAINVNVPAQRTINIDDTIAFSGTTSLINKESVDYDYQWVSSDSSVGSVVSNTGNAFDAVFTALAKGTTNVYIAAITYEGGNRIEHYRSNEVAITVLGGASINTSNIDAPLDIGTELEVTLNNDMTAGTYDNIVWSSSDEAVVTVTTKASDYGVGELTAIAAGTATIKATVYDDQNRVLKELTATVAVNGGLAIIGGNRNIAMYSGPDTVSGTNSLIPGTYQQLRWTSSKTDLVAVEYTQGNDYCTITPIARTNAGGDTYSELTFEALDTNGNVKYSSDPIRVTVVGGLQLDTSDVGEYIEIGDTKTVLLDNAYTASEYDSIEWTSSNASIASVTPDTDGAIVEGIAAGEGVVITATVVKDSAAIDSINFNVSVQGGLEIEVPTIGTTVTTTDASFDVRANNTLLTWTYDASRPDGGLVWSSTDDTVFTVTQSESNYNVATVNIVGEGVASVRVVAKDADDNQVKFAELEITVEAPAP